MANVYLQTRCLNHNFEEYSYENVEKELQHMIKQNEALGATVESAADKAKYEEAQNQLHTYQHLLTQYPDEFPVLHRIHMHGIADDEGSDVSYKFKEIDFMRPDIVTEEQDIEQKETQLGLECTFDDGTTFTLSALKYNGSQNKLMAGQISFEDDMLKKLNAENLKRIMDFCERCGFSTFDLSVVTRDGVIDADQKIADLTKLLEEYQAARAQEAQNTPPLQPVKTGDDGRTEYQDSGMVMLAQEPTVQRAAPATPTKPQQKPMSLDTVVHNFRDFISKDLHKVVGRSYWEHKQRINGHDMVMFSLYDKEDPEQYIEDGKVDPKKPSTHVQLFSYRLYVGQDDNGKLLFGYTMPTGKKMDDAMDGDLIGEIKKTGITHLNLNHIPNCDKMVWMLACAEKGIVPTGIKIDKAKAEKMIKAAEGKELPPLEMAAFKRNLAEQMEAYAKLKGKPLADNEIALVRKLKDEAQKLVETKTNAAQAAEFEIKFHNFRRSYILDIQPLVNRTIQQSSLNKKTGAADAIAAMTTLARTCDVVLGDHDDLDQRFGARLEELIHNPLKNREGNITCIRLTENEKHALSSISPDTKIKDLTSKEWQQIYHVLFERQYQQATDNIIQRFKDDEAARAHAKDHILIGEEWTIALGQVMAVNDRLAFMEVQELKLPDKHRGLSYERPKELSWRYVQEQEKKQKEAAQNAEPTKTQEPVSPVKTPTPDRSNSM